MPIITIVAMPMYQVISAASRSGMPADFRVMNAGPRTVRAIPMVDGVSSPSGMAVTVLFPFDRARRNASHVYARSPTRTPKAVPGIIRP